MKHTLAKSVPYTQYACSQNDFMALSLSHSWVEKESVCMETFVDTYVTHAMRCARFPICATRLSFSYF